MNPEDTTLSYGHMSVTVWTEASRGDGELGMYKNDRGMGEDVLEASDWLLEMVEVDICHTWWAREEMVHWLIEVVVAVAVGWLLCWHPDYQRLN